MNTLTDKRSKFRLLFLLLLTGLMLAASLPLQAQRNRRQRRVRVPEEVKLCPVQKEQLEAIIKNMHEWANAPYKPIIIITTARVPREKPDDSSPRRGRDRKKEKAEADDDDGIEYSLTVHSFNKYYGAFAVFLNNRDLFDDLLEATEYHPDEFKAFEKAAKNLGDSIVLLERLRKRRASNAEYKAVFEQKFKTALKEFNAACKKLMKDAKKMSSAELNTLKQRNITRRINAWKKRQEEEAAAAAEK